jgi:glyoxylase-like metal-dependent hydrolase (beta-lactamase superfamily II)
MIGDITVRSDVKVYEIGDALVIKLEEKLLFMDDQFLFPDFNRLMFDRFYSDVQCYNASKGMLVLSSHAWLIRMSDKTILVDAAIGNYKNLPFAESLHQLNEPFLERLSELGVKPEDIGFVLTTHLHPDHVGWNTRLVNGRWIPTFSNARYLFSAKENEVLSKLPQDDPMKVCYEESLLPIVESGQFQGVSDDTEVLDRFSFVATPGHSDFHFSIFFRSQGQKAVFSGDVMHHAIQVFMPEWKLTYCTRPDEALKSRLKILEYAVSEAAVVFSSHFGESSAGLVSRDGDRFKWTFI